MKQLLLRLLVGIVLISAIISVTEYYSHLPLEVNAKAVDAGQAVFYVKVYTRPGAEVSGRVGTEMLPLQIADKDGYVEWKRYHNDYFMFEPERLTLTARWRDLEKTTTFMVEPPEYPDWESQFVEQDQLNSSE